MNNATATLDKQETKNFKYALACCSGVPTRNDNRTANNFVQWRIRNQTDGFRAARVHDAIALSNWSKAYTAGGSCYGRVTTTAGTRMKTALEPYPDAIAETEVFKNKREYWV
jgi:hypothetical protein